MRLRDCHNFHDFRALARRRLPGPIFNYIDGGGRRRDDLSPEYGELRALRPGAQRSARRRDRRHVGDGAWARSSRCRSTARRPRCSGCFTIEGERAVAAAAAKSGTMFGVSSLGTVSLEELRKAHATPQVYQFYFHKDRGLNRAMMQRAKEAGVDVMMLTVDSITGGNRERDLRTGFSIPFRLTLGGMLQFAIKPMWGINYLTHERFRLPQLDEHVDMGGGAMSIGRYFTEMLDPSMNWDDVAEMVRQWNGQFCLKGVMSVEDARRAVEIGCTGIVLSNHGGRQLDGSRAAFDQLAEIVDAVGDRIDVMMDGGVQRGTHVLKALSLGAKAVGVGRYYLFPLAAAGQAGVERALGLMRAEIERGHEADGLRVDRPAVARQSAVSIASSWTTDIVWLPGKSVNANRYLFDHLVGACEQRQRDNEARAPWRF